MTEQFKRGMIGEVSFFAPYTSKVPLYARRVNNNEFEYLVYYRESDGAFPVWKSQNEVKLLPEEKIATEQEMLEDINYPGCLETDFDYDAMSLKDYVEKAGGEYE